VPKSTTATFKFFVTAPSNPWPKGTLILLKITSLASGRVMLQKQMLPPFSRMQSSYTGKLQGRSSFRFMGGGEEMEFSLGQQELGTDNSRE
jgi:hypothetical protein